MILSGSNTKKTVTSVVLQGKNILVIGTTSEVGFLESLGIRDAFSVSYHVPPLDKADAKKVRDVIFKIFWRQG